MRSSVVYKLRIAVFEVGAFSGICGRHSRIIYICGDDAGKKTRTPANIKIPGYPKYTIKFKYYFQWSFRSIRRKRDTKRELREHIYHIYISEISIDMNRECARFARSITS